MALVYLGLGSNLAPVEHLSAGLMALSELGDIRKESPWYESPALGFDGPDFINLVIALDTQLALADLALCLKQLETEFGRPDNARKFSSRFLDIDILLYDDRIGEQAGVRLPRPDVYRCAFVLRPLLDIAPDICCPVSGQSLADIWPGLADQKLTRLAHQRFESAESNQGRVG
jgi:2-amino-4-hydroxy-6-hydroxymethyldihydropteridine diphosphokinase